MGVKVLVVDDEEDIIEVLQDRLEAYGFAVTSATSGVEALRKFSSDRFDGIFLDIKMPEMGGIETLQQIRRKDARIPVIVVTASSTEEAAVSAIRQGATDYILKPFEWKELKAKIEKVFDVTLQ